LGRGKTFFHGKKGFSPPQTPPLFEKSGVFLPLRCRGKTINLSYPYSRKRALHVCQRQTLHIAKQCFTQDLSCASRWFVSQTNTIISLLAKRALHVCQRQTLHIAKQCFTQDLSCASRWFATQTNTFYLPPNGNRAQRINQSVLKNLIPLPR